MEVTRFVDAEAYQVPGHFGMSALRLQGFDASNSTNFWVGFSTFHPGGGAEKGATPFEKVYVVISGELTITTDGCDTVLASNDSCRIEPNEERSLLNNTDKDVKVVVIIPYQ